MSFETKKLREERAKVTADQRAMFEAAEKENRGLNAEEQVKSAAFDTKFSELSERVTRLEALEEREKATAMAKEETARTDHADGISEETRDLAFRGWARSRTKVGVTDEQKEAMRTLGMGDGDEITIAAPNTRNYRAFKSAHLTRGQREQRDTVMVKGTAADGGYTIPQGFVYNLEAALLAFGGPRKVADVFRTSTGNDLPWPTVNDTGNVGVLLAESTTIGSGVIPTVGVHTFKAYKMSSTPVMVSYELLQDSAFDLAAEIGSWVGIRIGRCEAVYYTTGTGTSQPGGIVVGATSGLTSASATAIASDEIIELYHAVDPAYRGNPGSGWMMHDSILSYIRRLKDGDGNYLWAPGLQFMVPDRLLGEPITINQAMDATSSNAPVAAKKHLLYGDLSKFKIRDVAEVRLVKLVERYADLDQVAFIAFHRTDSSILDAGTHPIEYLTQHA